MQYLTVDECGDFVFIISDKNFILSKDGITIKFLKNDLHSEVSSSVRGTEKLVQGDNWSSNSISFYIWNSIVYNGTMATLSKLTSASSAYNPIVPVSNEDVSSKSKTVVSSTITVM